MGLYSGLTVETTLDPAKQPFLYDHQINGTPVLPGVMGIEALAEAAKLLYPERHIGAIEDVNFHSPFKFYRSQPRTVTLRADFHRGWRRHRRRLPADRLPRAPWPDRAGDHDSLHGASAAGNRLRRGRQSKKPRPGRIMGRR